MSDMFHGIIRNDNDPQVIIPMPEKSNRVVLASIEDIPNVLYSLEVEIELKPKKNSLPIRKTYSNVTKISIINEKLLEILKVPGDAHASLIYLHLYNIESFNINIIGDTDTDDTIIDKKLWNIKTIKYKEDKEG